ncbi:S-layer homology domain-containing protein [Candidatus Peregrinibacteria bacterium]|nr:S-layer homology domain-containing protein [Candidatus Peregrinibacteria bacterium]
MHSFLFLLAVLVGLPGYVYATDLDGDGLLDTVEDGNQNGIVDDGETDYRNADTDGGGEADGAEVNAGRNPLDRQDDLTFDRDNDGLSNGTEESFGTDLMNPDSDDDGILDGSDPFPLDTAFTSDADEDGIADEWEERYNLTSNRKMDALLDEDGDGLSNVEEFIEGTDPLNPDSDRDGIVDGMEKDRGSDPAENPCLIFTPPRVSFDDTLHHWAETFVLRLHRTKILPDHPRIIDGYAENNRTLFHPDQPISRFELLKIALLGSCIPLAEDRERLSLSFVDLPSTPRPFESADRILRRRVVYTAVRHGIVQGYTDGSLRPDDPINRAEALKILLKSSNLPAPYTTQSITFTDIQSSDWFVPFVERALWYRLVTGYEDLTFRPGEFITRAEAAKLLYLIMLINPWINGYVLPAEGL